MANIVRASSLDSDPRTKDFRNFLYSTWKELGLPKPTALQYDYAEYLQENVKSGLIRDVGDRKELMGFRGSAKSYITTAYSVWRLKRLRTERVLVTSATAGFAGAIATFAFSMINNFSWLADMKPRSDQRQSSIAFDVAGAPPQKDESFTALSIFGQVTGHRASIILGDDLETPNTSDTEGQRQQLEHRMGEFGAIILPGGDIYLLGTAQTEQTVYRKYADEKGYELRIYPILYPVRHSDPKKDELVKYHGHLSPLIANALEANPELAGTSTEPTRFNEADIAARRKEWGTIEFERQFKMWMDAGSGNSTPLKLRDMPVIDFPKPPAVLSQARPKGAAMYVPKLPSAVEFSPLPSQAIDDIQVDSLSGDGKLYAPTMVSGWLPSEETICFVDPSGEGKDETTWTIMGSLLGRLALLWQGASLDGHTPATMKACAEDCYLWGVQTIKVESNFGGGMFAELLRPAVDKAYEGNPGQDNRNNASIETIASGKVQKEKRIIETLEPIITDHRLLINAEVLRRDFTVDYPDVESAKRRYYRLTYQMTRMTKVRNAISHDDRVDGVASAASHFIGVLLRRADEAAKAGRGLAIEQEGERMIELRRQQGLPVIGDNPKDMRHVFGRATPRRV